MALEIADMYTEKKRMNVPELTGYAGRPERAIARKRQHHPEEQQAKIREGAHENSPKR